MDAHQKNVFNILWDHLLNKIQELNAWFSHIFELLIHFFDYIWNSSPNDSEKTKQLDQQNESQTNSPMLSPRYNRISYLSLFSYEDGSSLYYKKLDSSNDSERRSSIASETSEDNYKLRR